jgi:hypothetical protein
VIKQVAKTLKGEQILLQSLSRIGVYRVMVWCRDGSTYLGPNRETVEQAQADVEFHKTCTNELNDVFKAAYTALTNPDYPVK